MLLNACKDIGLVVYTGKGKYMEIGRHRGMIGNEHIKIVIPMKKVKTFKYLGSLGTNQNFTQEEIKCRLKAGKSCYYSVQTLLSSQLLYYNLKIKIYKTIIFPVVLYGCETCSLTLRVACRLGVFENKILRQIFGPKRMIMGSEEGFAMRSFIACIIRLI